MTYQDKAKQKARNEATGVTFNQLNEPDTRYYFSQKDLDTLIAQNTLDTIEEVKKVLGEEADETTMLGEEIRAMRKGANVFHRKVTKGLQELRKIE